MENEYLNRSKINLDLIVNELYDFSKIGAISIPDILFEEARKKLLRGSIFSKRFFKKVPRIENEVIQEMEMLSLDDIIGEIWFKNYLYEFRKEYLTIYEEIAEKANFQNKNFSSLYINYYPKNSIGITPHRDYKRDIDLISIFVLDGNADFYICNDRQKTNSIKIDSSPGSLILLRAARNEYEQKYRPFHYLEKMEQERFSLVIRRRLRRWE